MPSEPGVRGSRSKPTSPIWVMAASLATAVGCASWGSQPQSTTFAGSSQKRAELSCPRERSERVDVGSWRGTGRPDVARVFGRGEGQQTVLTCREVDLNGDGRKDMLVFYLPDGRKGREEFDHDYDGIPDVKSYYEAGVLVRQELDVNFDGKPDLLQHFENGRITRTERLWEHETAADAGSTKSGGQPITPSDAKTAPVSPPSAAGAEPQDPAAGKSPPNLLPADSTPRSITPTPPPPLAAESSPGQAPPR